MLRFIRVYFLTKNFNGFNKTTARFFAKTAYPVIKNTKKVNSPTLIKGDKLRKKAMKKTPISPFKKVQKPIFTFNKDNYNSLLKQMSNFTNNSRQEVMSITVPVASKKLDVALDAQKQTDNLKERLINPVNYQLLNPLNSVINFKFSLGSLMYWGVPFNYTVATKFFLTKKMEQKKLQQSHMQYNSEMLLRYTKRNAQVVIHMPRIPSLIFKKYFLHRELVRQWNNNNSSDMLFGFGTGDCGFKPNETKTFIAKDTLVRAGLWIITRFVKKLSPIKLRFQGDTTVFRQYLNRLTPKSKKFKYFVANIEDSTAISFNGCKLRHAPRKRFRYHTNNFRNLVSYIKNFKDLKTQGMSSYKKYF